MLALLAMHSIATKRGDGLRPELLEALQRRPTVLADDYCPSAIHRMNARGPMPGPADRDQCFVDGAHRRS